MKLVKLFGFVMAIHAAVFVFVFAIPGCRSTGKKPAAPVPVAATETSPFAAAEIPAPPADVAAIRFSPTRPGTPTAAEVTAPETYTVVKGDNLWSIAKKHGLTVKELAAANKLRSDSTLKLGQVLTLPAKATMPAAVVPAAAAPAAAAPAVSSITHVVKAGETLGGIAKKYQVKVGEIATANNIADPTRIRVGQSLKIPGWQSPGAKPAATAATAPAVPAAPALAPVYTPAPPIVTSPFESAAPITPDSESPFITPAPETDAPLIRVEESGAPRIE